jgi:hypothetical protein
MKVTKKNQPLIPWLRNVIPALALFAASLANATPPATVWTGPTTNFVHSGVGGASDRLTAGVVLTRGSRGAIYNSVTESSFNGGTTVPTASPGDTEWAVGALSSFSNLTYRAFYEVVGGPGDSPNGSVNKTFVVHLINENIFLSLKLTSWGNGNGGTPSFTYTRSTPAVVVPPTVTITNPVNNAVFSAPANVKLGASASVSGGTVTNVQFFSISGGSTNSLGLVTNAPFAFTTGNLGAGAYGLTAVASASGVTATSAVVNISIVTPVAVSNSAPKIANNELTFTYTANPGLTYVVQNSSNLAIWLPLITNVPTGNSVTVTDTFSSARAATAFTGSAGSRIHDLKARTWAMNLACATPG